MIVVADTSPINYLVLIEEIDILAKMYRRVVIPHGVLEERLRPSAPLLVRNWIHQIPAWLEVCSPVNAPDESLESLDSGERDAIILAIELSADQLIVDDRQGRREARKRGIPVMGTPHCDAPRNDPARSLFPRAASGSLEAQILSALLVTGKNKPHDQLQTCRCCTRLHFSAGYTVKSALWNGAIETKSIPYARLSLCCSSI